MPYVMVPVPEEHVEDVMQFVIREVAKARLEPWDGESVVALYNEVDEVSRSLLAYAARAVSTGKDISERDAADQVQLRPREMAGVVRDLSERAAKSNRPPIITTRMTTETLPNGRTAEKRVLWMSNEVAPLIVEAERAELASVRDPLADRLG
jgi:hypothetical protein